MEITLTLTLCYLTDHIIIREVQLKSCHTLIKKCSFNFFEQCISKGANTILLHCYSSICCYKSQDEVMVWNATIERRQLISSSGGRWGVDSIMVCVYMHVVNHYTLSLKLRGCGIMLIMISIYLYNNLMNHPSTTASVPNQTPLHITWPAVACWV